MEMAGNTTTVFSPLIHHTLFFFFFFFFFFILLNPSLSTDDQQYLDCVPQTCGDGPTISYPFYIKDQQKSYCGYPGFELSCNTDSHSILNISRNSYIVHNIFYTNHSLRISNAQFLEKNYTCFGSIHSLNLYGNRFEFAFNYTSLYFWAECKSNLKPYVVDYCPDDKTETGYILTTFEDDLECSNKVAVPVELYEDEGSNATNGETNWEYYQRLLNRGFLLNWNASSSECNMCQQSGGRCGFDETAYHFICFCLDRPHASHCSPTSLRQNGFTGKIKIKAAIGASAGGFGILVIIAYCYSRKFSSTKSLIFWKKKENQTHQNVEAFLRSIRSFAPERYNYSDVKKMTNSFKDKLGEGGFGAVYKGKLPGDCLVAVKILNNSKGKDGEEFVNELASISRTSHVNIVTLLGFCFDGSHRALIYEFMSNGSLEKFIYDEIPLKSNRQLGWETLYQIAIGIARGLEYLHRGCNTRILHFDIKPHNILLDDDFCPKISDFGLAKLCPKKESVVSMLGARGTAGYIAPEVFCRNIGGVSHKSDVYSFGMMVLEMVGGRKNINVGVGIDHPSEIYFPHWIYNRIESNNDLGLRGVEVIMNEEENEKARKMILVSLWCIQTDPSNRPQMSRVLEMLEGKLESLQIPPKPFLSSASRETPDSSTTLLKS